MAGVAQVELAAACEGLRRAAGARGHDAIEHVDAALYGAHDVSGTAHSHQIARLVGRQHRHRAIERGEHHLLAFADGQAADRVAVEADTRQRLDAFLAQGREDAALDDAEQAVARLVDEGPPAVLGPLHRQPHGRCSGGLLDRPGRAFVERHGDVGIEQALDLDRASRRQAMLRAVDRRAEGDALGIDLAQLSQRHDLETARVGEDRPWPVHERVQAAQGGDALGTWPQHEVEGIAQHDFRAGLGDGLRQHRLHGAGSADRHEGRRLDRAVRRREAAAAGRAVGAQKLEGQTHRRNKQQSP